MVRFVLVNFLFVTLFMNSLACLASTDRVVLSDGAALVFSVPLTSNEQKKFGPGWKKATYISSQGERFGLFSMETLTTAGGAIFGDSYPPQLSPTGKYAVIDVLRVGVVDPGPSGKPEVQTRQYCPVMETRTGCILSNQTGELCGGEWDRRSDRWTVRGLDEDANAPMLRYQFDDANTLWKEYVSAGDKPFRISIREAVSSSLGVVNLMACDPPRARNITTYKYISDELKKSGDVDGSEYITNKIRNVVLKDGGLDAGSAYEVR
ncbi:hypothetical protein [Burkholderia sp. F1]|uniref:hypothetical protein n=1 Tax=Burkholderia sp. F1 TaxID=3366817 RepID=UPI003D7348CD